MQCTMYCSLLGTVSFGVLSLVLFRETFEGCRGSVTTLVAHELFAVVSALYYGGKFRPLMRVFGCLGGLVRRVVFFRGMPRSFFVHCYPAVGATLARALKGLAGPLAFLRNGYLGVLTLLSTLLKRPLNRVHAFGFFGVLVLVRVLFFALLVVALVVVVRFSARLLAHKPFKHLVPMVLLPVLLLANLLNFALERAVFSFWYLGGLVFVFGSLFCSHSRRSLKPKRK